MLRAILLACTIFVGAQGRIAFFGCPAVTPKPSVFYPSLIGTWFEYGGYFDLERVGTECTSYSISLFIDVLLTIETSVKDRGTGEIRITSTSYGIDQVSQNGVLEPSEGQNLILLETDYTNYAIFYTCEDLIPFIRRDFLYILTRSRDGLDEPSLAAVRSTLSANGLSFPFFRTNQDDCDED